MTLIIKIMKSYIFSAGVVIIAMLLGMWITWWIYNAILSPALNLPLISYWQMWLIRLILSQIAAPLNIRKYIDEFMSEMNEIAG